MKLPVQAKVFVLSLVVSCFATLFYAGFTLPLPSREELILVSILAIVAVISEIYATRIPAYKWEISSAITICLAVLFILGPPLSIFFVFLVTLISEGALRWKRGKKSLLGFMIPVSFNVSQLVVTITLAGLVLRFSGHQTLLLTEPIQYLWAMITCFVYLLVNLSFVTGIVSLTEGKRFIFSMLRSLREVSIQCLVLCILALLVVILYSFSSWHILLAVVPLSLVHVSFRSYLKLRTEARKTFEKMAKCLDERDRYTAVHSNDVAGLAEKIAREMELSEEEIEKVDVAARVHDIGKVAVPDSVLLKPGELSEDEWAVMKRHPVVSAELIEGLEIYAPVADAVRHEHERWDGTGYPDGLKGEQIPLLARVIATADVYNALITDRPYRKAYSTEEANRMIREMRGTVLDPVVVDALLRVLDAKGP
jgi:HD-GYP domain-containing protein (c-di-GMP phosphodiesterase class II)